MTVQGYARAVYKFSKLPTGIGVGHDRLARFFSGLLAIRNRDFDPPTTLEDFLTHYRFEKRENDTTPSLVVEGGINGNVTIVPQRWRLQEPKHLLSCHDLAQLEHPSQAESPGQIFFMRGYPSAEWLGLLGSKYHVDPEFFNRFLDFRSVDDRSNNFFVPPLPSHAWNIVDVPLITIGFRNLGCSYGQQAHVSTIRKDVAIALAEIQNQTLRGAYVPVGSNVVRSVSVLDENHFAIEQRISICFQPAENGKGWTGKFISILRI